MASKSRAARSKRTKDELISEMEALEAQLQSKEVADPTAAALARESANKARAAAKDVSVDAIVQRGAAFGLEVQRTVAGLTEQAVQKAEELKTLQDAVAAETAELDRLYGIDVASASIQALVEEHVAKKDQLEKQITTLRAAWDEERKTYEKSVAQRNADIAAQRTREQAEYDYRTSQERRRAEEAFKYNLQIAERNQADVVAQAKKALDERTAAVQIEEARLADFKKRVDGLDIEVKGKVDAAVAIATGSLKKELTAQFAIERSASAAETALERQRNTALVESNTKMAQEIEKLHSQLAAAKQQVTDITIKALESASGQQALQNVRDLVKDNGTTGRNGTKS